MAVTTNKPFDFDLIKKTFKTMDYSEALPTFEINFSKHSLKTPQQLQNYIFNENAIKLSELLNGLELREIINRLADAIEKSKDEYAKIAKQSRGISNGKEVVTHISKALKYYSIFSQVQTSNLVCLIFISEVNCLSVLAYSMAKALSQGYCIKIVASRYLRPEIDWFFSHINNCRFPEGMISCVFYNSLDPEFLNLRLNASIIYNFNSLLCIEKYKNKTFNTVYPLRVPFIIFDNCDLDSACEALINATWGSNLLFPWCHKEVIIQETVFEIFLEKLKRKVVTLSKQDIFPKNEFGQYMKSKIDACISRANELKIKYFPNEFKSNSDKEKIILLSPFSGNISKCSIRDTFDIDTAPLISLMAFRNISEAVSLANNNKQGLAASIWTENISIANEITDKLEVANVWINTYGVYCFEAGFVPLKKSGSGLFGGLPLFKISNEPTKLLKLKEVDDSLNNSKKAFTSWTSLARTERIKQLSKALHLSQVPEIFYALFIEYISSSFYYNNESSIKNLSLRQKSLSKGPIAFYCENLDLSKLLISTLVEGNSVIVFYRQNKEKIEYIEKLSKYLPAGLLIVLKDQESHGSYIFDHSEIKDHIESNEVKNYTWFDCFRRVSNLKNIWTTTGH